VTNFSHNQDTK